MEGTQPQRERAVDPRKAHLHGLSTRDVVTELAKKASELARKEVALAKSELKEDLRAEVRMASGLGVAGLCAIVTLPTLLVALILGLSEAGVMRGWLAALLVSAVVLAIGTAAGLVGWAKRVRTPLGATRRSVQDNLKWVKERIA
jgi:uncharacterized membrane protein YqjE